MILINLINGFMQETIKAIRFEVSLEIDGIINE